MTAKRTNSIRAFTLLESLLASSLLATAVIGIIVPFVAGAQNQRDDARRTLATNLAQELLEEILTNSFADEGMGHESDEANRTLYDCINDYNGYTEAPGQITNNCGNTVTDPAANGLSRTVSVSYTTTAPIFACIVVEVKHYGASVAKLSRLVLQP